MLEPQAIVANRYVVQACLGHGGTADVYAVYDVNLRATRVLKVAARPTVAEAKPWLRAEFEFLSLARSPHFPACFELLDDPPAVVLGLCAGKPLSMVEIPGHSTAIIAVLLRLWPLVQAVHQLGFTYRDLKPENVIVPEDDVSPWRLIDFGTVCRSGAEVAPMGTRGFTAPEVLTGGTATPSADVFSLGRCLAHLCERALGPSSPPSPLVSELQRALCEAYPADRPALPGIERLLEDTWLLEAWASPGGSCASCFAPLSDDRPPSRSCACSRPAFDPERLGAAASQLTSWASQRGAPGVAAWVQERATGGAALSDVQRLELARWYRKAGQNREALQVLTAGPDSEGVVPDPALASLRLRLLYEVHGPARTLQEIEAQRDQLARHVQWALNAAQILARHDCKDDAARLLDVTLSAHPHDGPSHGLMAKLLPAGPARDRHRQLAAAGDPPDPEAVRGSADVLQRSGERRRAIALLRGAMTKLPDDRGLKLQLVDLCLDEPSTWPDLEVEIRGWLAESPDDELLERAIDLYVRSERWAQLAGSALPAARRQSTKDLFALARVVAGRDPRSLPQLHELGWENAIPRTWLHSIVEAVSIAVRGGERNTALRWIDRLPASFAPLRADLLSLARA